MTSIHNNRRLINDICRLCLKQGNAMPSIFEEINQETPVAVFAEKITSIARVEITPTDGLPSSICHMCRRQVTQFHEFRLLIEMSDRALRTCLKSAQLQHQTSEMEMEMCKNLSDNEYRDILDEESPDFAMKDMLNYALLVPTNEGLQVWKINDLDQPEDLDKLMKPSDSPSKIIKPDSKRVPKSHQSKTFEETIHLQQPCDFLRAYVNEEVDENDQTFLNNMTSCQLCFSEFGSLEDLKNHITEHCLSYEAEVPEEESPQPPKQPVPPNLSPDPADPGPEPPQLFPQKPPKSRRSKLFKCRYCTKSFSKIILKKHLDKCQLKCQLKEVQLICNECGEKFTKRSDLRHHKATHLTFPLMCATCDKVFRNIQSFKMHMKRHTLGSRFNCETCGQSYYTNSELARHVQKHEDKRKYPCHLCDTSFLSKPELNRHMKYHNGVKKFECNLCRKSYYESGHLKVHQRAHTGERPFVCQLCNKGFVTRSKLARHTKIHSKEESVS